MKGSPGSRAQTLLARAITEAQEEGYLMGLAEAERALYQGEEALFSLLRSSSLVSDDRSSQP